MPQTRSRTQTSNTIDPQPQMLIIDAIDELLLDTDSAGRRPKTVRFYRQQLEIFAAWCEHEQVRYVREISARHLRRYMASRRRPDLSPDTADAAYRALRRFFYFMLEAKILDESPFGQIGRSRQVLPVKPAFHRHEVARLVKGEGLSVRDHAFVLFLLDTGCRVGEGLAVLWEDVNWGERHAEGASVVLRHTKTGRMRAIPLSAKVVAALRRYRRTRGPVRPDEPVWLNPQTHAALTPSGARQLCERIGQQLGIGQANPHKFRRTFAVELLRNGCDIFRLASLLGHSNLSLLNRYLPIANADLRDVHARFGPLSLYTEETRSP